MINAVIITPVPDVIDTMIKNSILKKSIKNEIANIHVVNLRDYGIGNYKKIDDSPYGGGSGMILMAEPLINALKDAKNICNNSDKTEVIFPSPQGKMWQQSDAERFSKITDMIFICGHYKGVDERFIQKYITKQFCIGEYILTSGEIPTMLILDSILRLVPGTLNNIDSAMTDSFSVGLLDHPHYTQPRTIDNMSVPDLLVSGDHKKISSWRYEQRVMRTKKARSEMWKKYKQNKYSFGEVNDE